MLGHSSLKAALDLDWDDPSARNRALVSVLSALEAVGRFQREQPEITGDANVQESLAVAHQVKTHDVEGTPNGTVKLRQGVAKDRRISVQDGEMRHRRKSRSQRVDGYKRHVLRDLDNGLVRAVGITAANVPEAKVAEAIGEDLTSQQAKLAELHIDRAYLSSKLVQERPADLVVYGKAWPVCNGDRFPKTAFALEWERETIRCPNEVTVPFKVGGVVHFPPESCAACPHHDRCTNGTHGRSVSIHPDERLLSELRERQQTPAGRAKLRERVAVEHSLAHLGRWQGPRARYLGESKNLFDLRRTGVVHKLHVLQHIVNDAHRVAARLLYRCSRC